ncbi:putative membrane protein [Azorhizobium sp. AG788]|uniref:TPM domain-containing protein n=1 Tax=Azorhizobium sp. AG788 TaxID=2183897 RepID=UPI001061DBD3|nr:hypothetical protein [Azorhizobium sp. AG788]TDT99723.1 putative membrane protein [Azorhizobium sp. AG788]
MTPVLDHAARERILAAVRAAEAQTSAEIRVVVLSRPLIRHTFYPVLWAALAALALPWLLVLAVPLRPIPLLAVQGLIFLALLALLSVPALARRTVPPAVRRAAARAAALDRFLALGIHLTESRTGLMILAAAPDRLIEVVADETILAKLGPGVCEEVCAVVSKAAADGDLSGALAAGVNQAGIRLSETFPASAQDRNELPDHVIFA